MPAQYDVAVVGGGPAGLATAIEATKRGFRTVVLDGRQPPVDKACGEGLLPDAIERLRRLGVTIEPTSRGLFRGIEFSDEESRVAAKFPDGEGWGVRRTTLQNLLAERAEEMGVELLWGLPVTGIDPGRVVCRNLTLGARWIVGADGMHSQVRRWTGLDGSVWSRERVAFRQHFAARPSSEYVQVVWGEAGQCYITPVGEEEISVAVITSRRQADYRELLACFPSVKDRFGTAATSTSIRGSLTASRRLRRVCAGQVALVGDASGSVDAITGEGICIALRQAEAVTDAMQGGDLQVYHRQHRAIMRRASFMAAVLCSLGSHDGLRRRVIRRLSQDPQLFERILGFHVGATGVRKLGLLPSVRLGAALLPLPVESMAKRR